MIFEQLASVMPPPEKPVEAGATVEWLKIEEKLETKLPSDYKWFINTYGSGMITSILGSAVIASIVFNPFSADKDINLFEMIDEKLGAYRYLKDNDADGFHFPAFPETGGLLPLGSSDAGDEYFWVTSGRPDDWSVLIHDRAMHEFIPYNTGLLEHIFLAITGKLSSIIVSPNSRVKFVQFPNGNGAESV